MNRQWTTTVLFLLAFGLGCLERLPASIPDPPRITAGFNGHVKSGQWFPVWIEPAPDLTLQSIDVMQQGYGKDPATVLLRFGADQDRETGGWRALVWMPRYQRGEAFLRCRFVSETGQPFPMDVALRILSPEDLLVAVISNRPDEFQFLGNIEHGRQRITRNVAGGPELLKGSRWQDLQAVDLIVLDGPPPLRDEDRHVLRHWIIMGGTLMTTDRALRNDGSWGFLPAPPPDIATREASVTGDEAASLLDGRAPDVLSIPFLHAIPESFVPLVTTRSGTLVGGQELGRGRVLVSALDWTGMELRDRALYESARRTLWSGLFSLRRPANVSELPNHAAIPREARIRFLMRPLLWFLLGCCLLLGPVHWIILKWWRRQEYMMVTLPAGAVLLAVAALVAGHAWRPRDTLIHEISIAGTDGNAAWTSGVSGILSPGSRQYTVATRDPETIMRKIPYQGDLFYSMDRETPYTTTLSGDGMRIDGVHIERWAMRFFSIGRPDPDGTGLRAEGRLTTPQRIRGTVTNRTPHSVRDVWVLSDADRVFLGDLEPKAAQSFDLVITDPRDHPERKCPGCGRYHLGVDPFEDRDGEPPIPPVMKELGRKQLSGGNDGPYVIGLAGTETPLLRIMNPDRPSRRRSGKILTAPVTMQWAATSPVPDRFIRRWAVPDAHDAQAWASRLQQLPIHDLPHGLAVKAAFQTSATPAVEDLEPAHASHDARRHPRPVFFALPVLDDSSILRIEWDREFPATDPPADDKVTLEAFEWEHDRWIPLGALTNGVREFRMTGTDRTIFKPTPGLSLRERPEESRRAMPATRDRFRQGTLTVEVLHGGAVNDR